MWLWIVSVAQAQTSEEVTVYGDARIEEARDAVIAELEGLGYDRKIVDKGDRVVLKHQSIWRGKVVLFDDGFYQHKRQGVVMSTPQLGQLDGAVGHVLGAPLCLVQPTACVRIGGLVVSPRKLGHEEQRTAQALQPTLLNLGDTIADVNTERRVEGLPDELDLMWRHGVPLMGDSTVDGWPDRRAHLLAYWESRTETEWGEQVRQVVEGFIRGEVMASQHPYTEAEIAEFHSSSRASRPLPFTR